MWDRFLDRQSFLIMENILSHWLNPGQSSIIMALSKENTHAYHLAQFKTSQQGDKELEAV